MFSFFKSNSGWKFVWILSFPNSLKINCTLETHEQNDESSEWRSPVSHKCIACFLADLRWYHCLALTAFLDTWYSLSKIANFLNGLQDKIFLPWTIVFQLNEGESFNQTFGPCFGLTKVIFLVVGLIDTELRQQLELWLMCTSLNSLTPYWVGTIVWSTCADLCMWAVEGPRLITEGNRCKKEDL